MLAPFDLLIIVAVALGCSVIVGAATLLVLRLTRRATMLVRLFVVVVAAVLSVVAGIVAISLYMYVSEHDLVVMVYVAAASTVVTLGVAALLGRAFARDSRRLRGLAQDLGDGRRLIAGDVAAAVPEFSVLAADLARTSEKLAIAREEVATMDAARRELLAWISHDLRTPLAGLRAMAEALEDGLAEDPQRFHRQMRSQVDHLSAMVDDLFELSKITSGALALSMQPVSLYDLASDAVAELSTFARSRSVTLRPPVNGDFTVVGDPRELARVVGNLLVNAIQHSPPGSEITVATAHGRDDDVILSVEDAGGGIAEEDLSKVFQAGWRASASRTPAQLWGRSAGAGLGLAIVHGIVEAHSGGVTVSNVAGGCRFDVRLPRHEPAAA
ncbi:HAMP domain-containing histidine kinase [Microbacteriaceae bacterium VKM Ac-2855]|nr:HAMP domain-containing histidine kinase [Microbacteriaceae bacterium VKM Ac-2855]